MTIGNQVAEVDLFFFFVFEKLPRLGQITLKCGQLLNTNGMATVVM